MAQPSDLGPGGDPAALEVGRATGLGLRTPRGRLALAATVTASAMASLDATVVNVALPRIGDDFDAGLGALQWVLTGYLLALASLILLGGALGDRFGRRRVFIIGTVWFALASLACGLAPSVEALVAARVLQGVGGALLVPGSLAILQASFRVDDRHRAVGAWSGLGGVAGAIGPLVGGALVDGPGWRWAFLLNLPLAAVTVVLARRTIPESRDLHAAGAVDVRGALLATLGLGLSTWALTEAGSRGWLDPVVLASGVASVAVLAGFVVHLRRVLDPLVSPALFRDRTFTVLNIATVALYGAIGISFFLVAYELQVAAGWTALEAGLAMAPVTVMMLLGSARSGQWAERHGPRAQLLIGPLLAAAGLLLLTRVGPHAHYLRDVVPGAVVFGLGLVCLVAPLTAAVMASADPDHVSVASGVNNAIARTAGLISFAVIPVVSGLASAVDADAVTRSFRAALVIAAVVAAVAGPLAWFELPRPDPRPDPRPESRPDPRPDLRPGAELDAPNTLRPMDGAVAIVQGFYERMQARDWAGAAALLASDVCIDYVHTRERFVGSAFIAMNEDYPDGWTLQVVEVLAAGDRVVARVRVAVDDQVDWCVGFYTVAGGVITSGIEHWIREGSEVAPAWRQRYTTAR